MGGIVINGELISTREAYTLIEMLCNDAKQIAGEFHGMNRSAKFRANWPDQYLYADMNWKSFMKDARAIYAQRLGDSKIKPEDARKIHLALVLEQMISQGQEKDNRLQISRNTQQFVGDRFENKKITENHGKRADRMLDLLMSSTSPGQRFH